MAKPAVRVIAQKMQIFDWEFMRGSALLSVGMALASLLGFAFSLVLASVFTPRDYGTIQYVITLSMIVAIGTQPFGQHVVARFIGKFRDDIPQLRLILANAWVVLAGLFGLTVLVAALVLPIVGKFNVGILVIFFGLTVFYSYWGLSRGFMAPRKLTAVYLGSNIVQLVLVWFLIRFLGIRSALLALLIYGLSYLPPVTLALVFFPFPIGFGFSPVNRDVIGQLVRFSRPIWLSHAGYMLYSSLDVLLLARYVDVQAVGVYVVARTLATVCLFVPSGLSTLLMPKAAALPDGVDRRLLIRTLAWSLLADIGVLILYLLLGPWFVRNAIGPEYVIGVGTSLILAFSMILRGLDSVIAATVVGIGRPGLETIARLTTLLVAASVGLLAVPRYGMLGAATAMAMGALGGLLTYGSIGLWNVPGRARSASSPR